MNRLTTARPPTREPIRAVVPAPHREPAPWWLGASWALAVVATLVMLVTVELASTAAGVLVGSILFVGGALLVRALVREDGRFAMRLYTAAFLARYVATIVVIVTMALTGATELAGGSDYILFEAAGWGLAENWRAGNFTFTVVDKDPGYFYLVASVYALVGRHIIAPALVNALLGALTAVLVFLLGRDLFGRRVGVIAGILAAFLPTLLFWSAMLYKDTLLACSVAWACYLSVRLTRERTGTKGLWLAVSFLPLFMIRPETGVTLGATLGILILWTSGMRPARVLVVGGAVAGLLLLLVALDAAGLGRRSMVDRFMNPLTAVFAHREEWADRVGQQATGLSRALYGKNLLLSPHLLVVASALPFFIPIPGTFEIGMNMSTFLLPGQIVWLSLLPALAYGAWATLRRWRPESVTLLLFAGASVVGVALAGYFTNPRYLVQIVPLLLIFIALGLVESRRRWALYALAVCMGLAFVLAFALYRG